MLIEYAISAGEGTLINYGVLDHVDGSAVHRTLSVAADMFGAVELTVHAIDGEFRIAPAAPDCTTGE